MTFWITTVFLEGSWILIYSKQSYKDNLNHCVQCASVSLLCSASVQSLYLFLHGSKGRYSDKASVDIEGHVLKLSKFVCIY